jgi:hypothetical protein
MPRIPDLPQEILVHPTDKIPIYDAVADATKYIAVSDLIGNATANASVLQVAQTAHGFVVGQAVRFDATANTYVKAQANLPANAYVEGVVSAVSGVNNFSLTLSGYITGLSGLTVGKVHYLSDLVSGALSPSQPYADSTVVKPVLYALTATTGVVQITRGSVNLVARTYARLGVNFGVKASTDLAAYKKHLQYLQRYVNKLRIAIPSWDDSAGITNLRALVGLARDFGFKTSYGITAAGTGHNLTYYNNWKSQIPTEAAWAYANGVDTFFIGNEEDWWVNQGGITGVTETQVQTDVLTLAATLKGLYPTMRIVYSTAEGEILNWQTASATGNYQYLDALGFNCYGDKTHFTGLLPYIQGLFGSKLFLSEAGPQYPYAQCKLPPGSGGLGYSDAQYQQNIADIMLLVAQYGIDTYWFTYDWGGSYGSTTDWGLYNGDGTYKPGVAQLFGIPR